MEIRLTFVSGKSHVFRRGYFTLIPRKTAGEYGKTGDAGEQQKIIKIKRWFNDSN